MTKKEDGHALETTHLRAQALHYLSAKEREKYQLATNLGLLEQLKQVGWAGLSAKETGRIGGLLGQKNRRPSPPQP